MRVANYFADPPQVRVTLTWHSYTSGAIRWPVPERRHETAGLILRDVLRGEETWLVDETMEKRRDRSEASQAEIGRSYNASGGDATCCVSTRKRRNANAATRPKGY
jgi:hypothetical protein